MPRFLVKVEEIQEKKYRSKGELISKAKCKMLMPNGLYILKVKVIQINICL